MKEDDEGIRFHTLPRGASWWPDFTGEEGGDGSACPVLGGGGKAGALVVAALLGALLQGQGRAKAHRGQCEGRGGGARGQRRGSTRKGWHGCSSSRG
jgi:hypothetical protein